MEMDHRDSDLEGGVGSGTVLGELEGGDDESESDSPRQPLDSSAEQEVLCKIKRERESGEEPRDIKPPLAPISAASPLAPPPPFSLPLPFPFPHPGATFLPPVPAFSSAHQPTAPHHTASSASSHSSESSTSSQTHQTWPFDDQFKQMDQRLSNGPADLFPGCRIPIPTSRESLFSSKIPDNSPIASIGTPEEQFKQLYEISEDPKRKEFLDDLFCFMQRRGTPINRLPIMAKSVLDLFELYNLVIQRGGLVDVINKKLWQEIIKGLHLPSSITSAAFTLRTQYMKYLYPYECEKRRLSTPGELQAAIDGNRREGRRGSYGTYAEMMQRSPSSAHAQMSPLSLVTAAAHRPPPHHPHVNGGSALHPANNNHLPHHALMPPTLPVHGAAAIPPAEFEARMVEYVKLLNKELRTSAAATTPPGLRQTSPPTSPPESALAAFDMSRLTLWNLYHNQPSPPEPQKEPINLEKREEPAGPPPAKRHQPDLDANSNVESNAKVTGTHIKISSRSDGRGGTDNSLVVSMDINGTMYQGVLFAQSPRNTRQPS